MWGQSTYSGRKRSGKGFSISPLSFNNIVMAKSVSYNWLVVSYNPQQNIIMIHYCFFSIISSIFIVSFLLSICPLLYLWMSCIIPGRLLGRSSIHLYSNLRYHITSCLSLISCHLHRSRYMCCHLARNILLCHFSCYPSTIIWNILHYSISSRLSLATNHARKSLKRSSLSASKFLCHVSYYSKILHYTWSHHNIEPIPCHSVSYSSTAPRTCIHFYCPHTYHIHLPYYSLYLLRNNYHLSLCIFLCHCRSHQWKDLIDSLPRLVIGSHYHLVYFLLLGRNNNLRFLIDILFSYFNQHFY